MSALASPLYVLQPHPGELVSLSIYALVIGPTASGKEGVRTAICLALEAAGRGDEFLYNIPSMPASHEHLAIPTEAQASGVVALAIDEAGLNLKTINSTANGHQQQLLKGLMSIFGQGFRKLTEHKVRDKSQRIATVERPRATVLWTSTPGAFIDAISAKDSESGQLNRFGKWWLPNMPPLRKQRVERSLMQGQFPPHQAQCAKFKHEATAEYLGQRMPDRIITTTPEALALMDAFEHYVEDEHIQGQPARNQESWG
ncbi:hypothetical protein [Paracoccus sp. MC1862]|uniref:hypothetical protein n=1 Tax=Paracoccus sp. MC1862 TaxID=2760307 RepID=UPI001600B3A3|nr:hypothetical protein [Paracoccus sp. MC1862]MBB1499759.1 hypothetical protein [Paracoccus sp. MC1862]QQO45761.1 hypothetical protein JGR78_05365 [Paracoccus sp. MC1862]